jgi:DNA-binding response OmpR family regulator
LGPFVLDIRRVELRRDGVVVPLRPKPFALLQLLASNPGTVLSKEVLIDAVWPGVVVTEDSLKQAVHDLRVAQQPQGRVCQLTSNRRTTTHLRVPYAVESRLGPYVRARAIGGAMATRDSGQGRTVLVFEADDLIRQLLSVWLTEAGYAAELRTSLEENSQVRPDLIVLNVPGSTSLQRAVDSLSQRYPVPIVAISATFRRGLGASAAAARRFGVHRVLPKPFTREELLEVVAESLAR